MAKSMKIVLEPYASYEGGQRFKVVQLVNTLRAQVNEIIGKSDVEGWIRQPNLQIVIREPKGGV